MARVLSEAYVQDGLLSYAELQLLFLTSTATVSRALDAYQRQHNVILPSPGTVLDMGRAITHKDLIIRLHLQGHTTLEIARQTHHHPAASTPTSVTSTRCSSSTSTASQPPSTPPSSGAASA